MAVLQFITRYGACLAVLVMVVSDPSSAQISPDMQGETVPTKSNSASRECEASAVSFQDNANLTRDEKIALMDAALMASLNKYDECQSLDQKKSADSSGGGVGSTSGGSEGMGASVASSGMRGTDPSKTLQAASMPPEGIDPGDGNAPNSVGGPESDADKFARRPPLLSNGKVPEDIPPADNDGVLEAQIRQAAESEPDPEIRKKLWNEYRKYKGLPPIK